MSDKFDGNGLFKLFSTTGNETLSVSVYNGLSSIVVFSKGSDSKRPKVKFNITGAPTLCLIKIVRELIQAQPDTRIDFYQMNYNRETRAYERLTTFVFFKDDKKCYGVEITNHLLSVPIKFMFKAASTFATDSSAMSEHQRSELGFLEFKQCLESLQNAILLSRIGYERNMMRSNGNKPRQASNGDPYRNSNSGNNDQSSEDIFG